MQIINKIIALVLVTFSYSCYAPITSMFSDLFPHGKVTLYEPSINPNKPAPVKLPKTVLNIIGVGDVMLGTNYPSARYLPVNRGKNLLTKPIKEILRKADITFGNLEGTILNKGRTIKNCKRCYAFRMPEYLANILVTAGFDVVSIANNHVRDFGKKGIKNTLRVLDKLKIKSAGLLTKPTTTINKDGVKYGFAAFAPNIGTADIRKISKAKKIVSKLALAHDIVIVSFHGGAEGTTNQRVTRKTEYYYGENRGNVYKFAHAVIDAGADIVFGHGPHVTRAVEVYKKRFIIYSLGNFCTYGRFNLRGVTGVAPIVNVKVKNGLNNKEKGEFISAQITPIRQIKFKGVKIDKSKKAISLARKLTKADGFLTNIDIDANGFIKYIEPEPDKLSVE